MSKDLLENAYNKLCNEYKIAESFKIVEKVDEYRQFWRPSKARIILLAESHKYTEETKFSNKANYSCLKDEEDFRFLFEEYPQEYVKFVYCLGYGEDDFFKKPIGVNSGTWQFWRIFYACLNKISINSDFKSVLKKSTSFEERLKNKVVLLRKLKEKGIWLVDASIVAIDGQKTKILSKNGRTVKKTEILSKSWDHYTEPLLDSLSPQPKHIIVIGKGVEKALKDYSAIDGDHIMIGKKRIGFTVTYQPQAHVPAQSHLKDFEEYFKICNSAIG